MKLEFGKTENVIHELEKRISKILPHPKNEEFANLIDFTHK